ncbi:class C sortase [Bifidobacterium sp. ESL0784]|uniref:class C sortase n=1 Tax=Bifidobacterium sp. ESL0784 TaxID=2983231 RepID=UPI0023F826D4|nr:class C sortase [Bifidobacterium sp. ESL0784]MDF7640596.1 class C sortase [Bifidobacterium sp. ESL0784]
MNSIPGLDSSPSWIQVVKVPADKRSHGWSRTHNMLLSLAAWLCIGIAMGALFMGLGLRQYRADQATLDGLRTDAALAAWPAVQRDNAIRKAQDYNGYLAEHGQPTLGHTPDPGAPGYADLLDAGNGVMGRIVIPAIGIDLPVYHGIGTKTLEQGIGHMPDSSLPVGGLSTRPILSAHNGLAGAKYFDDLPKLKIGDSIIVHVMGRTLYYKVEKSQTVRPDDINDFRIQAGRDLITLTTCTNGTATRLGVTAHRVPGPLSDASAHVNLGRSEGWMAFIALVWPLMTCIGLWRTWHERPVCRHHAEDDTI